MTRCLALWLRVAPSHSTGARTSGGYHAGAGAPPARGCRRARRNKLTLRLGVPPEMLNDTPVPRSFARSGVPHISASAANTLTMWWCDENKDTRRNDPDAASSSTPPSPRTSSVGGGSPRESGAAGGVARCIFLYYYTNGTWYGALPSLRSFSTSLQFLCLIISSRKKL